MGILMVPIELVPNSKGLIYFGEETMTSLIPGFGLNAVVIRTTLGLNCSLFPTVEGPGRKGSTGSSMHMAEQQG